MRIAHLGRRMALVGRRMALVGRRMALVGLVPLGLCIALSAPVAAAAPAGLDAAARAHPVAFLDRIGWGADAAQLRQLQRLGATRLLEAQLRPAPHPALPAPIAHILATLPANTPLTILIPPLIAERRAARQAKADDDGTQAQMRLKALNQKVNALARQAMAQQILLALYAPNQLQQRLIWFWTNHFNVFHGGAVGPMLADYSQRVIAPHALGHFRDLLRATMFSPPMLLYLNNAQNARGHINENYAREVMELHTMGVGSGYSQTDVTALAYVLTGLGVDLADRPIRVRPALRGEVRQWGLTIFNPARHDPTPRTVMGRVFRGHGVDEIEHVVDMLAESPATARHVSFELAQYFVTDHPDPAMVAAMTRTWRRTHGDIRAVLATMFTSPQFATSLSRPQFKDPMRYVLSAARAAFDGRIITNPQPIIGALYRLGEPLYGRTTPDGYPIAGKDWNSPGQLTARFAIARQIAGGAAALFRPPPAFLGSDGSAAPAPRSPPPILSQSAVFQAALPGLRRGTLLALAQADNRRRWNALFLSSPDFMTR